MMLPKNKPLRDALYRAHVRNQRCIICATRDNVQCAHIGTAGRGLKSGDDETLPLCATHHRIAHAHGEISYLAQSLDVPILREMIRAWCREEYRKWAIERARKVEAR